MNSEIFKEFFSINAGEAGIKNPWTEKFLPAWSSFKYIYSNDAHQNRESIILKRRKKSYYELENISSEEGTNNISFKEKPILFNLYGVYSAAPPRKIIYYEDFYTAQEEIKHIVRIHERIHVFHHVNEFKNVWVGFTKASPVYKEFLAQLFTFKCVEDTYLEKYFKALSKRQPFIYQTWYLGEKLSLEEVYNLYCKIKEEDKSDIPLLDAYKKHYPVDVEKNISNPDNLQDLPQADDFIVYEKALLEAVRILKSNPAESKNIDFEELRKRIKDDFTDDRLSDTINALW